MLGAEDMKIVVLASRNDHNSHFLGEKLDVVDLIGLSFSEKERWLKLCSEQT